MNQDTLFSEFNATTKADWLNKVIKDLKGKPLEDLNWQLEDSIELPPFYHPDDKKAVDSQAPIANTSPDWEIGEYIDVHEIAVANEILLESLQGGAEAPLLRLYKPINQEGLSRLLQGVDVTIISLHFGEYYSEKQPTTLFHHLLTYFENSNIDLNKVNGSIDFDPLLDWAQPPIDQLAKMIKTCQEKMPNFCPLQINTNRFHGGSEQTSSELAYTIAKGSEYLARLNQYGIDAKTANAYLQIGVSISKSYFVEIAKLRALKILWANILNAYGAEADTPSLAVHFSTESQDEQTYTNMIRASTQAMSAIIGGADKLYVLPANRAKNEESSSFTRRIARNVQHLLKMESHFNQVIDAGAGSYYIETVTKKLAENAWEQFKKLEKEGAFS